MMGVIVNVNMMDCQNPTNLLFLPGERLGWDSCRFGTVQHQQVCWSPGGCPKVKKINKILRFVIKNAVCQSTRWELWSEAEGGDRQVVCGAQWGQDQHGLRHWGRQWGDQGDLIKTTNESKQKWFHFLRIAWSLRCLTCLSPRSGPSNMQSTPPVPFLGWGTHWNILFPCGHEDWFQYFMLAMSLRWTRSSWQSVPEVQSPETQVEEWTRTTIKSTLNPRARNFYTPLCICENIE